MPDDFVTIGPWRIAYDREATEAAYSGITEGAEACDCKGCLNYLAQRDDVLPAEALELLAKLGIDRLKEAEAYEMAGMGDPRPYRGWFHLFGEILEGPGHTDSRQVSPTFELWFETVLGLPKGDFGDSGRPVLQLEFTTWLPWRGRRKRTR
jgi:hypothetical protein